MFIFVFMGFYKSKYLGEIKNSDKINAWVLIPLEITTNETSYVKNVEPSK